ncbi:uncharacterized protein (DUF305 family) [Saccharopolyspora erythraea NRRL 2338]|nr:hypothetical protein N599_27780 [Saccharopolyspora erythraea D]PFG94305.1 uncharacterized protein (DUF305 family) [Saccharopolyspora erythraea NRRL 2338]
MPATEPSDVPVTITGPLWDEDHRHLEGKHVRRSTIIGAVLAGGLALAACSPGEEAAPPAPGTPPPATAQEHADHGGNTEHSATDQEFARQFLAHQGQILDLAELASEQSTNAQVKTLAGQIQQAQKPELDAVNNWLESSSGQESGSAPEDNAAEQAPGGTLLSDQRIQQISALQGPEFDKQWAQAMVGLHEAVLGLARTELEEGSAEELRGICERVISSQQAELQQLRNFA